VRYSSVNVLRDFRTSRVPAPEVGRFGNDADRGVLDGSPEKAL